MLDNSAIQMLSMILDNRRQDRQISAQRGHEMTMHQIESEERRLDNQIQMNWQEQMANQARMQNIEDQLSVAGVQIDALETDSHQFFEDAGNSFANQAELISQRNSMIGSRMAELSNIRSSMIRGSQYAGSLSASFDDQNRIDPLSDFGSYQSAMGNPDRMLEMLMENNIDVGDTPEQQSAFIAGMNQILQDSTAAYDEEAARLGLSAARVGLSNARTQADFQKAQIRAIENDISMSRLGEVQTKIQMGDALRDRHLNLIPGSLVNILQSSEDDKAFVETMTQMTEDSMRISPVMRDVMADMLGFTQNEYGQWHETQAGFLDSFEKAFVDMTRMNMENIIGNPQKFASDINASANKIQQAISKYENNDSGTALQQAVLAGDIDARDLASILSFTSNANINASTGGGFMTLQGIVNNVNAGRALSETSNTNLAVDRMYESFDDDSIIRLGEEFSALFSRPIVQRASGLIGRSTEEQSKEAELIRRAAINASVGFRGATPVDNLPAIRLMLREMMENK